MTDRTDPPPRTTRTVTAHIPIELAEAIDRLAAQYDRPRGWIIKTALADYVDIEERRFHLTLAASDFAHNHPDQLVPHTTIQKWVETADTQKS